MGEHNFPRKFEIYENLNIMLVGAWRSSDRKRLRR